jgi:hypothetical protein
MQCGGAMFFTTIRRRPDYSMSATEASAFVFLDDLREKPWR